MSILGGANGFVENQTDCLLFAFTNEGIDLDEKFENWWKEFVDIAKIPGLSEAIRVVADADQRPGDMPAWKYMVVYGFSGNVEEIKEAINVHKMETDSELWFFEAISELVMKPWSEQDVEEHFFLALTNPVPGLEAGFRIWYDKMHLKDVVDVSVYRSGRRYLLTASNGEFDRWKYLALYRFVGTALEMHDILFEEMNNNPNKETESLESGFGAWIYSAF